jgi:2-keto-4-pentenoate hydratase/2-oxohepta-3-ene-1,7-dioic acid hydratase in catechol pathway
MSAAIALGDKFLDVAHQILTETVGVVQEAILPLDELQWLSPLDPPLVRDFTAFEQHVTHMSAREGRPVFKEFYQIPLYFKINPLGLIGHEQEVPWPNYTNHMDYELELGLVIGQSGRNLKPQDALAHLFGITIFNDFSARDVQGAEMHSGFGPSKSKDFATALGPWITTRDEVDITNLEMVARVNGVEWSRNSSSTITWTIPELIAYASRGETLWPGELLGSGTVGTGTGAEHAKKLQPGDVVELEVQGIGILRNHIGQPEAHGWEPEPRQKGV